MAGWCIRFLGGIRELGRLCLKRGESTLSFWIVRKPKTDLSTSILLWPGLVCEMKYLGLERICDVSISTKHLTSTL